MGEECPADGRSLSGGAAAAVTNLESWNKEQETFFDGLSEEYGLYDFAHESRPAKQFADEFLDYLELKEGNRVLEFGCGRGEWILRLLSQGFDVTGVDLSQKSLGVLSLAADKMGLGSRLHLFKGDVQQEAADLLGRSTFDTVFCCNLLHHVWDIERTVTQMAKLTRVGGKVVAYEPNPWHFWWYLCPFFDRKFKWSSEKGLLKTAPWKIKSILEKVGLENVAVNPGEFFPFISAEKTFQLTKYLQKILIHTPLINNFPAVYLVGGYKK